MTTHQKQCFQLMTESVISLALLNVTYTIFLQPQTNKNRALLSAIVQQHHNTKLDYRRQLICIDLIVLEGGGRVVPNPSGLVLQGTWTSVVI